MQAFAECSKTELDLTTVPVVNIGTVRGEYTTYRAVASTLGDGPLEFRVLGVPDLYLDPSRSSLYVKCKIVKPDGGRDGSNR